MSPQRPVRNAELGAFIRDHRKASDLTLRTLAERTKLDYSWLNYLEQGRIEKPAPDKLASLARGLGVAVEELYARAGYELPEALPGFKTYLRKKYDLPGDAIGELEGYLKDIRKRYGGRSK